MYVNHTSPSCYEPRGAVGMDLYLMIGKLTVILDPDCQETYVLLENLIKKQKKGIESVFSGTQTG